MHIIQQENPLGAKSTKARRVVDDDDDEVSFSSRSIEDRKCTFLPAVYDSLTKCTFFFVGSCPGLMIKQMSLIVSLRGGGMEVMEEAG